MELLQKVLDALKPKVKRFGFTKKIVKSVAANIADKLDVADDASDEDINNAINSAIDATLPFLSLVQSHANLLHEEWKKKNTKIDDDTDEDDDDEASKSGNHRKSDKTKGEQNDDEPAWFKKFREEQEAKFKALEGAKTTETRRTKLEKLLKDTGTFGTRTLKSFDRMSFDNEDEFNEFISEIESDLKAFNQERADAGLLEMGTPPGGKGSKQEKKEEAYSDEEIDALAD